MKDEYVYYSTLKPPFLDSVPKTGLMYVECLRERRYIHEIGRMVWGWAVYNKPLSPADIEHYGLIKKPKGEIK